MKCLVLAAGYATRLYPLTENFPKPLLRVGEKTILDWLLTDIDTSGLVDEYIVITNRKFAAHFHDWAKSSPRPVTVLDDGTVSNESRLGAVADMMFAIDSLKLRDDLLVVAGDNLLDFSLSRFIRYTQTKRASCVMRFYEKNAERLKKCGVAEVGADDRVTAMTEKPPAPVSHWVIPPFYFFTDADAQKIPHAVAEGCGIDAPGSYIAWLCGKSPVYAMEMPGKRFDIGNLESYEQAQKEYRGIVT